MSTIRIENISITDIKADAIVNAANEYLAAGGGVCGAIFKAAGMSDLSRACDKIGGCKTGSAVITPGFKLSKYIIHAVGPVYRGGNNGEAEKLYGAYQASMQLAFDNGISSIAFPLISAGIFGYPAEEAWKTAVSALCDFTEAHKGYDVDIIFCVLDKYLIELGTKVLNNRKSSV